MNIFLSFLFIFAVTEVYGAAEEIEVEGILIDLDENRASADVLTTTRRPGAIVFPDDDFRRPKPTPAETSLEDQKEINLTPRAVPSPEAIARCMLNCPVTSEYGPICGSNGVTYTNPGRMICAQNCGERVTRVSNGRCVSNNAVTMPPVMRGCVDQCTRLAESYYFPVCGTNMATFKNPGTLLCAQSCGVRVLFRQFGACPGTPTVAPTVAPNNDVDNPPSFDSSLLCYLNCGATYTNFDRMCGTDGRTYFNNDWLSCAQRCGINTSLAYRGPCSRSNTTVAPTIPTPTPRPTPTKSSPSFDSSLLCYLNCGATYTNFDRMCGTDGRTYFNNDWLTCAQRCGINTSLAYRGPCSRSNSAVTPTIPTPTPTARPTPRSTKSSGPPPFDSSLLCYLNCGATYTNFDRMCGTDGRTYFNNDWLSCAQRCGINTSLAYRGPCTRSNSTVAPTIPTPTPGPTPTPRPTPSPAALLLAKCMERCPSTNEFNPVCGTNSITYDNPGKLHCARVCGVDVSELRGGPCIPGRRTTRNRSTPAPTIVS